MTDPSEARAYADLLRSRILTSAEVKRELADDVEAAAAAAVLLVAAYRAGHKMILFGNGGSAADAQHIAAELTGHFYLDRPPLPALALTVDTSALTAIGNDYGFEDVYARQITGMGEPGDVAIGLTTSGGSKNVVRGLEAARDRGLVTIALTGRSGGRAGEVADVCVRVPSDDTPRIQESHTVIGHSWAEIVEAAMFGPGS
ncbi:MAG TPA: SIS domain-containing protein [Candidatus Saccharimonadales bacterium]|nr:SIS domain-containing protein [Candidatus Saccharimonadales bacterium]